MIRIIILILLSHFIDIINSESGYADFIKIGPEYCIVGTNLNQSNYPSTTIFNINNPNDPTETYIKIQGAINYVSQQGGIIHIVEGTYIVITYITINGDGVQLNGDGIDKTIIKLADYAPS